MGANCCSCYKGTVESVHDSALTLADLEVQATDLNEMIMNDTRDAVAAEPSGETSNTQEAPISLGHKASDILWSTGSFSDPIPNGFYSVIKDDNLKSWKSIPTLDELHALADKDIKADVILIDIPNDSNLLRYTQLVAKLVSSPNSNPDAAIKKIAKLVEDVYKHKTLPSPRMPIQSPGSHDFPLLGQIKHSSCRARALLFKVLADTVGLQSRIVVGFPSDLESSASIASYHHMSVVVVLDTVEMLVDLVQSPGVLRPLSSTKMSEVHKSSSEKAESSHENRKLKRCALPSDLRSGLSCSTSQRTRRGRSTAPEISDEIVSFRAARAMREPLKQSRLCEERCADDLSPHSPNGRIGGPELQKNVSSFSLDYLGRVTGGGSKLDPRKTVSLPSSPQNYQRQRSVNRIWNEVLESPMFQNKPLLPYKEWNIDFSELTLGNDVGFGFFGVVRRGTWNGTDVAVKMNNKKLTAEGTKDFFNEISIHSRLRHPNVILFLGACTKPPRMSLVTEFMEKGSLFSTLFSYRHKHTLSWATKLKMMCDICRGLVYIHRMGIIHRDIKSTNCLLDKSGRVKICDFGLSITMEDAKMKDIVSAGTPEWMAPELIRKEPFSEKCDIFSFGVVMWEICTLFKPWQGVPTETVISTVANGGRLKIPQVPVKNLIAACWTEPERRPSSEEILSQLLRLG